jgi:hypothetical protein
VVVVVLVGVTHSEQPLHFGHEHFFTQDAALFAHHDLHKPSNCVVAIGVVVVRVLVDSRILVVGTRHSEHPLQLAHPHFFDHSSELSAHQDLQAPGKFVVIGGQVVVVGVEATPSP